MMSGFEITCVNKNPSGAIVRIGGQGWSLAAQEAIMKIITEQLRFCILLGGQYVEVGVRGDSSNHYLAIEPEGYALHEVAGLPSC